MLLPSPGGPCCKTIKLQNFPSKPEYFTCTTLRVRATKHNMCTNMHPGCKEAAWANAQQTFQARGCLAATEAEGNGLVVSMSWYASKRSALHIPGSRSSAASFLLRPFRPMAARLSNLAVLTLTAFTPSRMLYVLAFLRVVRCAKKVGPKQAAFIATSLPPANEQAFPSPCGQLSCNARK